MIPAIIFYITGLISSFYLGIRHEKQYTIKEKWCSRIVFAVFVFGWVVIYLNTI